MYFKKIQLSVAYILDFITCEPNIYTSIFLAITDIGYKKSSSYHETDKK